MSFNPRFTRQTWTTYFSPECRDCGFLRLGYMSEGGFKLTCSWFCPDFTAIRSENTTEIEFIRQVRAGEVPWRSKRDIKRALQKCQYDWTTTNMLTFARLLVQPPAALFTPLASEQYD